MTASDWLKGRKKKTEINGGTLGAFVVLRRFHGQQAIIRVAGIVVILALAFVGVGDARVAHKNAINETKL
jgi:hypothetical protein